MKDKVKILVDYTDLRSMTNSEKRHNNLLNKCYKLVKTEQIGFNKFQNIYEVEK